MEVIKLNSENFQREVRGTEKIVLVDFYADWCGPCKMMSPIIEEIAEEVNNDVKVCKLNVDECQDLAMEFNVMSIPTLIIFKDGMVINTLVGLQDKETILNSIK